MEITYLGWSCFRISQTGFTLIMDPFDPEVVGLSWKEVSADVVSVSHQHKDHNYIEGVSGERVVIDGPGEYELGGVKILGIPSFHDKSKGSDRGINTMYRVEMGGVSLLHLGDLGQKITQDQLGLVGEIDVCIVPVGGVYTIDYEEAAEVVSQLEPAFVIPCHYALPGVKIPEIASVDKFLEEMGDKETKPVDQFSLSVSTKFPEETEVKLLTVS